MGLPDDTAIATPPRTGLKIRRARASPKGTERRREILRAAQKLFAEQGYDQTGLREIGDAVGILGGSIYAHFKAKQDILDEIVQDYASGLLRAYKEAVSAAPDVESALEGLIRAGIEELIRRPEEHAIMLREFSDFSRQEGREYIWQEIYDLWLGVLREGAENGLIQRDLNLQIVYRILANSVNATAHWYRPGGPFKLEELVETQVRIILRGVTVAGRGSGR